MLLQTAYSMCISDAAREVMRHYGAESLWNRDHAGIAPPSKAHAETDERPGLEAELQGSKTQGVQEATDGDSDGGRAGRPR